MTLKRILMTAGFSALLATGLTGCTSPVDASSDDVETAQGKLLAFSYDTVVDQFTHMSCTNLPSSNATSSYNTSAYFSYRMGAYNQGGVTLNDAFYSSLRKYTLETQSLILAASPANTNTVIQLALRGRLDYQNLYTKSGTSAVANQDYYNMLTDLGGSDVALTLVSNPQGGRIKHIRNGTAGGYLMEGSLYFSDSAAILQNTRNFLSGNVVSGNSGLITLTYTNGGATSSRSQLDTVSGSTVNNSYSVWGRGFTPSFGQPSASPLYTSYPANVVTGLTEQSLDGSVLSPTPVWTCPVAMQMRIVRGADLTLSGANCTRASDPPSSALTSDQVNTLKILRNTLKTEDWYIDLTHRCIIPKHVGTDCYGTMTGIKYTMGDACTTDPTTGFSNCVQYASTCYRNN